MISFKCTVEDIHGIHARPAGILVECAKKYDSDITLSYGEKTADAKRLLSVMSLGAKHGDELTVTVNGTDELSAADSIKSVIGKAIG